MTIFGTSAGGMSVGYHVCSRISTGLFHRAISCSGFASTPSKIYFLYLNLRTPFQYSIALGMLKNDWDPKLKILCELMDCLELSTSAVREHLQRAPAKTLAGAAILLTQVK